MKERNVLLEKSLHFAARIVKLYQYLSKEKHASIISKQLIRSGTSIDANANKAVYCEYFYIEIPPLQEKEGHSQWNDLPYQLTLLR